MVLRLQVMKLGWLRRGLAGRRLEVLAVKVVMMMQVLVEGEAGGGGRGVVGVGPAAGLWRGSGGRAGRIAFRCACGEEKFEVFVFIITVDWSDLCAAGRFQLDCLRTWSWLESHGLRPK